MTQQVQFSPDPDIDADLVDQNIFLDRGLFSLGRGINSLSTFYFLIVNLDYL